MQTMIVRLMVPVAAMAGLGIAFGVGLAYALKIFHIEIDPKVVSILAMLPGSNCGACGKAGCAGFADALSRGEVAPSGCAVNTDETRKKLANFLGIDYDAKVKTTAAMLCNGGARAKDKYSYNGIASCRAASLVFGGFKQCNFGCLGLGDCVEACPFGAIIIGADNLPVIDADKCTSCGKCLKACPKNLIVILPLDKGYYVKCSSKDTGAATARACKSGCIACMKCVKACPSAAVKVESNLARIDPGSCQNIGKCLEACPTKVIRLRNQ